MDTCTYHDPNFFSSSGLVKLVWRIICSFFMMSIMVLQIVKTMFNIKENTKRLNHLLVVVVWQIFLPRLINMAPYNLLISQ